MTATPSARHPTLDAARDATSRARRALLDLQRDDGHWLGELQGDTILESETVLLLAYLGRERDPKVRKLANYLLAHQQPDGGWGNYPGGPSEVSVSVKAYFALKLAGHDPDAPHMAAARACVRGLGGAERVNSFTRFYLALLGQVPYDNCPAVPPELVLLPTWSYVNIHAMSAWTRTILVPLSLVYAHRPVRQLPREQGVRELFLGLPDAPAWPHPPTRRWLTWTNFFLGIDAVVKRLERWGLTPLRRLAVRRAAAWVRDHFAESDGVGAIYPPMVYTVIALRCLGVADDDPEMRWALKQLDDLEVAEGETLRLQPCLSPVWDTALAVIGLADAAVPGAAKPTSKAARWLLDREVRRRGDWAVTNPKLEPGGWCFEYNNAFYPDTDDTAMVLMALARTGHAHFGDGQRAARRAIAWLLGMQDTDGGWAAFDRDINREVLTKVPFADHNAMLDPSCPDITARVLEALGHFGFTPGEPAVDRALDYLVRTQEPFGGWPGRWGVNYVYGTWQVLAGLAKVGVSPRHPAVRRAVAWLESVQQPCGGWGETCASYDDPSLAGKGEPTASQTAWALLGLLAAGGGDSEAVRRGVEYLAATQRPDGTWAEEPFTGTGFPKVFYLKYHLYPLYFPLMALARYKTHRETHPDRRPAADFVAA